MKFAHCCRFMLDDMLSLQGNTAVYLLYAHARIAAIGRKAGIDNIAALAHDHPVEVDHEKERNLAMHVSPPPLTDCQFLWLARIHKSVMLVSTAMHAIASRVLQRLWQPCVNDAVLV